MPCSNDFGKYNFIQRSNLYVSSQNCFYSNDKEVQSRSQSKKNCWSSEWVSNYLMIAKCSKLWKKCNFVKLHWFFQNQHTNFLNVLDVYFYWDFYVWCTMLLQYFCIFRALCLGKPWVLTLVCIIYKVDS